MCLDSINGIATDVGSGNGTGFEGGNQKIPYKPFRLEMYNP